MNRLRNSRRTIKRWLCAPRRAVRRKGFGIHSPFAFDFVRRVIDQPCRYYAYDTLGNYARQYGRKNRYLRLIFRVALFVRPQKAAVAGKKTEAEISAIRMAAPQVEITDINGINGCRSLIIVTEYTGDHMLPHLSNALESEATVIIANLRHGEYPTSALADRLWSSTQRGMLFRGSDTAIFVGRQHLPHQRFDIWL